MMFSKEKNKTEEQYKEFVKPFETEEFFKNSVKETPGDITPESLKKFCSEPTLSSKIAQKASEKQFGKHPTIYNYSSKKKNGPVAEENKEVSCIVPFPGTGLCHFSMHFLRFQRVECVGIIVF